MLFPATELGATNGEILGEFKDDASLDPVVSVTSGERLRIRSADASEGVSVLRKSSSSELIHCSEMSDKRCWAFNTAGKGLPVLNPVGGRASSELGESVALCTVCVRSTNTLMSNRRVLSIFLALALFLNSFPPLEKHKRKRIG
jgi:hypothetical protein